MIFTSTSHRKPVRSVLIGSLASPSRVWQNLANLMDVIGRACSRGAHMATCTAELIAPTKYASPPGAKLMTTHQPRNVLACCKNRLHKSKASEDESLSLAVCLISSVCTIRYPHWLGLESPACGCCFAILYLPILCIAMHRSFDRDHELFLMSNPLLKPATR